MEEPHSAEQESTAEPMDLEPVTAEAELTDEDAHEVLATAEANPAEVRSDISSSSYLDHWANQMETTDNPDLRAIYAHNHESLHRLTEQLRTEPVSPDTAVKWYRLLGPSNQLVLADHDLYIAASALENAPDLLAPADKLENSYGLYAANIWHELAVLTRNAPLGQDPKEQSGRVDSYLARAEHLLMDVSSHSPRGEEQLSARLFLNNVHFDQLAQLYEEEKPQEEKTRFGARIRDDLLALSGDSSHMGIVNECFIMLALQEAIEKNGLFNIVEYRKAFLRQDYPADGIAGANMRLDGGEEQYQISAFDIEISDRVKVWDDETDELVKVQVTKYPFQIKTNYHADTDAPYSVPVANIHDIGGDAHVRDFIEQSKKLAKIHRHPVDYSPDVITRHTQRHNEEINAVLDYLFGADEDPDILKLLTVK
jgi:hypothetical protein